MNAGPPAEPRWGMPDALLCFLVGFFTANVSVAVWIAVTGADTESLGVNGASLVGLWIGLIGSMLVVTRKKGTGDLVTDFGMRFATRDPLGIPVGALFQVIVVPLLYLPFTQLISDLGDRLEEPARELTDRASEDIGVFVLAVLVVVGAPIVEELFYRGLVLRSIERRFGPRVAIVASAAVFGAVHFQALQFPALFALGLLLAWLTIRYDRLGPAIFAHAGFNAVTMAILIATR